MHSDGTVDSTFVVFAISRKTGVMRHPWSRRRQPQVHASQAGWSIILLHDHHDMVGYFLNAAILLFY